MHKLAAIRQNNAQYSKQFFMRGVEEGFFREDVNYELLMCLSRDINDTFLLVSDYEKFSVVEMFRTVMCTLIRGICTSKGIAMMDEFLAKK